MKFRWIGKSLDGEQVILNKLSGCPLVFPEYATERWLKQNEDLVRTGVVLDVETTGLDCETHSIIEIAILPFQFNKDTAEILSLGTPYTSFQDPGEPLSPEISQLTGITDEMLEKKSIDWPKVHDILASAQVIIAHNAKFDRGFIDLQCEISKDKIWACSLKQIGWNSFGFSSAKLEMLNIYHGFFTDSHRALNDVEALLYLLSLPQPEGGVKNYLAELLNQARTPAVQVIASSTSYNSKDLLKSRSYSWDNQNRFWHKSIPKTQLSEEMKWLEEHVYLGSFAGMTREIALHDTFK